MKALKTVVIIFVGAVCLFLAVHFTENYVADAVRKDKTLAEAIIDNQLKVEISKAEENAQAALGTALVTTSLRTKPPKTTPPEPIATTKTETTTTTPPAATSAPQTTTTPDTTPAVTEEKPEEVLTEFTRGGLLPADRNSAPFMSLIFLSADEKKRMAQFLIDHYFLDGNVYSANETRPLLKQRKELANNMETGAITALNMVMNGLNLSDITKITDTDFGALKNEVTTIRDNFKSEYSYAESIDESFAQLYTGTLRYYDRLIQSLGRLQSTIYEYNNSSNPFFAAGILAGMLNNVIIPEVMAVMEESFDLIEASQNIFLEGTQGTVLLTREEVADIIANPGLILGTGLA